MESLYIVEADGKADLIIESELPNYLANHVTTTYQKLTKEDLVPVVNSLQENPAITEHDALILLQTGFALRRYLLIARSQ